MKSRRHDDDEKDRETNELDRRTHNEYVKQAREALDRNDIETYHKLVEMGDEFDRRKGIDD